jgi:hypothetical protein
MSDWKEYNEIISEDPDTGAKKGVKLERFDLMPMYPLQELARVYGWGATKYDDRNWEKGYSWGKSFAALMRHLTAYWMGRNRDPESNLLHLAHAAWHCFTLMEYIITHPEKDDRSKK